MVYRVSLTGCSDWRTLGEEKKLMRGRKSGKVRRKGAQTSASSEFRNRLRRRKKMDNGVERTVGCLRRNNEENDLSGHVLLG